MPWLAAGGAAGGAGAGAAGAAGAGGATLAGTAGASMAPALATGGTLAAPTAAAGAMGAAAPALASAGMSASDLMSSAQSPGQNLLGGLMEMLFPQPGAEGALPAISRVVNTPSTMMQDAARNLGAQFGSGGQQGLASLAAGGKLPQAQAALGSGQMGQGLMQAAIQEAQRTPSPSEAGPLPSAARAPQMIPQMRTAPSSAAPSQSLFEINPMGRVAYRRPILPTIGGG